MLPAQGKIPQFQQPTETVSPEIDALLNDRVFIEDGIQYKTYKVLNPSTYYYQYYKSK